MFDPNLPAAWLWYADRAYVSTRLLWFTGGMFDAPIQAHRAIELYLKAILVAFGSSVRPGQVWGHDLDELRTLAAQKDDSLDHDAFNVRVGYFQRYFDLVRYPADIDGRLEDGSGIRFAFDANILALDQIVAYLRPRIHRDDSGSEVLEHLDGIDDSDNFQVRALRDSNAYLPAILSRAPTPAEAVFDTHFSHHLPGC